jgi:hypothetical protein
VHFISAVAPPTSQATVTAPDCQLKDRLLPMDHERMLNVMTSLADLWANALVEKRYKDAMVAGLLVHITFGEAKYERFAREGLNFITDAISAATNNTDEETIQLHNQEVPTCSFCNRSGTEIRMAAGPNGFICDSCVSTLHQTFFGENREPPLSPPNSE